MKRYELVKITDSQMEQIKNGVEIEDLNFSEEQYIQFTMLLGAYGGEEVESVHEWLERDVRSYNE